MNFKVFQQLYPKCIGQNKKGEDEFEARLEQVASIEANNAIHALKLARRLPVFLKGNNLGKFPIIGG